MKMDWVNLWKLGRWVQEHVIDRFFLFFLLSAYVLTAYEPLLKKWYDCQVMPFFLAFVPSHLSFLTVLLVFIYVIIDLVKKARNRYYYSGRVAALLFVVFLIIVKYRVGGEYEYVPWLKCIAYVDVLSVVLFAYLLAFVYSRYSFYRLIKDDVGESHSTLLHDWPISEKEQDILNLSSEAMVIAKDLKELDNSKTCSLAISAPWGAGKTSFLNMVIDEINRDSFECLVFNPRDSKSYQVIQEDFFQALACLLSKYNSSCNRLLKDYMASLQLIDNRGIVEKLLNFYRIWDKKSLKNTIKEALRKIPKRILVVIDDFDRLSKDEIMEVLKLIDSNAAFNNLIFLTAFDKVQVNRILGTDYQTGDACFVDKFFDIEFVLPSRPYLYISRYLENEMVKFLNADDREKLSIQNWIDNDSAILNTYLPTLRDVKRFINLVVLDYVYVKDEVDLTDFLRLHLVKYKYPERYSEIHRFKYVERAVPLHNRSAIYLQENLDNNLDIYNVLVKLFPNKDETLGNRYRRICMPNSFEFYFSNQVLGSMKVSVMRTIFQGTFEEACSKIDVWIGDQRKLVDLLEHLGSYEHNSFGSSDVYSRYATLLAYVASKVPQSRAYNYFLNCITESSFLELTNLYHLNKQDYKQEILSVLTDSVHGPTFPFLQQFHYDLKTGEIIESNLVIKDSDIWPIMKKGFLSMLESDSVSESTFAFFYKCIDHMESSRLLVLDGGCIEAMRHKIECSPAYYIKKFVRLGGYSSNPEYNSIACDFFWEQLFETPCAIKTFIKQCYDNQLDGAVVAYNFWQLYEANGYTPIDFHNQGNVQEKIDRELHDEVKLLLILREIQTEVEKLPVSLETHEEKEEIKNQLLDYENRLSQVNLYIKLNANIRNSIQERLAQLEC